MPLPQPANLWLGNFEDCVQQHPVRLVQQLLAPGALKSPAARSIPAKPRDVRDMLVTMPALDGLAKLGEHWKLQKELGLPLEIRSNGNSADNKARRVDEHQQGDEEVQREVNR